MATVKKDAIAVRPAGKEAKGLLIRGANGDLHFLRDELLDATRVTEPEMKKFMEGVAQEQFKKDPKGFSVNLGSIEKAVPVSGSFAASKLNMKSMSTVMCPGVMKDKDFKVIIKDIKTNNKF